MIDNATWHEIRPYTQDLTGVTDAEYDRLKTQVTVRIAKAGNWFQWIDRQKGHYRCAYIIYAYTKKSCLVSDNIEIETLFKDQFTQD
jgi:hypothetical protein